MTTAQLLRDEGRAEGRVEGRVETLMEQLTVKFGPLDDSIRGRVHAATTAELQTWAKQVLTATTLDDALG